jgi:hypothetical protein
MKQKEKWNRYQQLHYQGMKAKKDPVELAKIRYDLQRLETQLVQVKRISTLLDSVKKRQQTENNLDNDSMSEFLQELTEASTLALDTEKWCVQ